jgi:hypothetical protein
MMEQDAAPAGVPRKHALGRPREMPSAGTKTGRLKWLDGRGEKGGDEPPGSKEGLRAFLSPEPGSAVSRGQKTPPSGAPRGAPPFATEAARLKAGVSGGFRQAAKEVSQTSAFLGAPPPH